MGSFAQDVKSWEGSRPLFVPLDDREGLFSGVATQDKEAVGRFNAVTEVVGAKAPWYTLRTRPVSGQLYPAEGRCMLSKSPRKTFGSEARSSAACQPLLTPDYVRYMTASQDSGQAIKTTCCGSNPLIKIT